MGTVLKFDLVDRLRKSSRAYKSIVETLFAQIGRKFDEDDCSDIADDIFEELWLDGFKIVPRDDGGV